MENDINALMKEPTKKLKSNLTYKEHAAMEELAKRKDLIITNADKGGAVVKMDIESYIKEVNWMKKKQNGQPNNKGSKTRNYFLKKLQMV